MVTGKRGVASRDRNRYLQKRRYSDLPVLKSSSRSLCPININAIVSSLEFENQNSRENSVTLIWRKHY